MRKPVSSYRTPQSAWTDYREKYGCEGLPLGTQMEMRNMLLQAEEKGIVSENDLHETNTGGANEQESYCPTFEGLQPWGMGDKQGVGFKPSSLWWWGLLRHTVTFSLLCCVSFKTMIKCEMIPLISQLASPPPLEFKALGAATPSSCSLLQNESWNNTWWVHSTGSVYIC